MQTKKGQNEKEEGRGPTRSQKRKERGEDDDQCEVENEDRKKLDFENNAMYKDERSDRKIDVAETIIQAVLRELEKQKGDEITLKAQEKKKNKRRPEEERVNRRTIHNNT